MSTNGLFLEKGKGLFISLLFLITCAIFFTSCSKDEDDGGFNLNGTNLVGTWAEPDWSYDGYDIVWNYITISEDGTLSIYKFYKEKKSVGSVLYSSDRGDLRARYKVTLVGDELYTEGHQLLVRLKRIDDNTIKAFRLGNSYDEIKFYRITKWLSESDAPF